MYAAEALTRDGDVAVDVLERLPCPYGLVRYGVAPDHPKIRSITATLQRVLEHPGVRFLGNVRVGTDLDLADLRRCYDAVVYAYGAAEDRRLGIPGEELTGSGSATDFVAWYCGHPDTHLREVLIDSESVAVVGVGNVALDVARLLARPAADLRRTDVPPNVLDTFVASRVREVHLLGRRGPAYAKFTTKELRELGELDDVHVHVAAEELEPDPGDAEVVERDATVRRNLDVLRGWTTPPPPGWNGRTVRIHFRVRPYAVLGTERVEGLELARTAVVDGSVSDTGQRFVLPVQAVFRAVGYRGRGLAGLPFDERSGVVPSQAGRVLRDGEPSPGEYVTGWIKRGPTGVIGTNKSDAKETVTSLLADRDRLPSAPERGPDALPRLLADRGVQVVTWDGWRAVDAAELALGRRLGRERVKLTDPAELLATACAPPVVG